MCPTNSPEYMREYAKKHYKKYFWNAKAIAKRSSRNKARRILLKGKKSKWEVDHKNGNALDNSPSNLRLISRKKNRVLWWQKSAKVKAAKKKKKSSLYI
jgi:hypothetical protein